MAMKGMLGRPRTGTGTGTGSNDATSNCDTATANFASENATASLRVNNHDDASTLASSSVKFTVVSELTMPCTEGTVTTSTRRGMERRQSFCTPLPAQRPLSNDLSSFTIDKLNYKSLQVYGRDDELDLLRKCWTQTQRDRRRRQVVMVGGISGSGKTRLVQAALRHHGNFVRGKFVDSVPYSGIATACAEICGLVLAHPDTTSIQQELVAANLSLLTKVIPILAEVRFLKIVSEALAMPPLVLVLDDLQNADAASLDLLEYIIRTSNGQQAPQNIMIVGIYRSNQVDGKHILKHLLDRLDLANTATATATTCDIHKIHIQDLSLEAVNSIVQDLLDNGNNDKTLPLAQLCLKRTNGNAFFLLHFLQLLHEAELIQFNFLKYLVVDMGMHSRLLAQLGAPTATTIRYTFVHDKIFEAALSLISPDQRPSFSRRLGNVLVSHKLLNHKERESILFVAVGLLNESIEQLLKEDDREALLELAQFNYTTSCKAVALSAFGDAATYAGKGIDALPSNNSCWQEHYKLTLGLYSIKAKAEGFEGNVDVMERCCKAVLDQTDKPIEDKFDVYKTWIDNLANRGDVKQAVDLSFDILAKFNCRFPKNPALVTIGVLGGLMKLKMSCKSLDLSNLPPMTDQTRIHLVDIMEHLAMHLFLMHDPRLPLVIFKVLKWTLKYGYCEYSAPSFVKAGVCAIGFLDDIQGGSKYGDQAMILLEKSQSRGGRSRTAFVVHTNLYAYTKPWRTLFKPALEDYDQCLQSGDTESAMWAIHHYIEIRYMASVPLQTLAADLQVYIRQMKDLNREIHFMFCSIMLQTVLNLMGRNNSTEPTNMVGDAFTEELKQRFDGEMIFAGASGELRLYETILLGYFGEYARIADHVVDAGPDFLLKINMGQMTNPWDIYLKGVSCFATARQTGRKRYAKLGRIFRSKIKKWVDDGDSNIGHYLCLLDAEAMALQGDNSRATQLYETTILLAARSGLLHDAALASERAGDFYLTILQDRDEARYRFREAVKYWTNWGAIGKVAVLERQYADLLQQPPGVVSIRGHHSSNSISW
ncbi:expressed unknown protein [Seminavis robusta]|uniref:Orc1-like AAA ATPase domain-containing protein n=1 Tax=Seminavis robusta TaxID=568900 RepID=A0A9N8EIM1_9STRA|nr:expressed unknown protein [Seminavis robusta]|eukprot:Sro1160_g247740.2 n/a (1048) ;mRNA; f:20631-24121